MIGSFSASLRSWPALVQKRHLNVKRGTAIKLFSAVIKDSPVDTGRLRSNWRTSLTSPDYTTSEGAAPMAQTVADMVATSVTVGNGSVYLMNSLPYTYRIEYEGWSHTKAPQGMVNRNVDRFRVILAGQVRFFKKGGTL